jgi:predicted O-linked N-acetylglucosamine transferase (SPINDLY family)
MGAEFIDCLIADRCIVPVDQQPFYSERLEYLPGCYQPNDSKREISERTPSRAECSLPEQGLVFCCFNNSYKIAPAMFEIWMRLLAAVPDAVLWLLEANAPARDNLRREAAARGIEPGRLIFAARKPLPEHLARHRRADLFLDTLPCNAHTTASDALWASLPVLTCAGETFAGRVAASLLVAVGLPELIATSLEQYEAAALTLAREPARLADLKRKLERQRPSAPLFDIARLTENLEAAYARIWQGYRSGGT